MGELAAGNYLNPLTLEAQMFLNSMETYGKSCNQMDEHLYQTLDNVIDAIEKFLGRNLSPIVATEHTKLVDPRELNTIVRFYHCGVCKLDLGKSADKATAHLANGHKVDTNKCSDTNATRKKQRKNEKENRANRFQKLPKKTAALFAMDMPKFLSDNILIAEKLKNIPEYDTIEKELLDIVQPLFPYETIKIYKFGSRMKGVGTRNSDLDLFIDIGIKELFSRSNTNKNISNTTGKTFNNFENTASPLTMKNLMAVYNILKKNNKSWQHLKAIESARVPILQVLNVKTGIECDIGFSNSLGYCNTKLMEYLFELQPVARRMCIFLKKWLERSKLNDNISTYTISLMVIYFLQLNKKLPPTEILQFSLDTTVNVGPWIANFIEKKISDLNIQRIDITPASCYKQLYHFFEFYSKFDFEKFVVCPYFGRLIDISQIEVEMPQRYSTFVKTDETGKQSLQLNKCMVVQDPIQLNHNVSKAVTPNVLQTCIHYFRQSADALS